MDWLQAKHIIGCRLISFVETLSQKRTRHNTVLFIVNVIYELSAAHEASDEMILYSH